MYLFTMSLYLIAAIKKSVKMLLSNDNELMYWPQIKFIAKVLTFLDIRCKDSLVVYANTILNLYDKVFII